MGSAYDLLQTFISGPIHPILHADEDPHVMLVGGRGLGTRYENELKEPWFFTLDASQPLPDCLDGSKNEIDGNVRRRPALIKTEGKSKARVLLSRYEYFRFQITKL